MVPRVILTPGWLAIITPSFTLAGVIITQAFNLCGKRIDAGIKQADRQHERALDHERRDAEAKSGALMHLMSGCRVITERVQQAKDEKPADDNYQRGATIRALDRFKADIGGDTNIDMVMAVAGDKVCDALDAMLDLVMVQQRKHRDSLAALGGIGTQLYRLGSISLEDDSQPEGQQRLEQYERLLGERTKAFEAIGSKSNLDVNQVIELCERIKTGAREDRNKGSYA
jgi:hypothetical protein